MVPPVPDVVTEVPQGAVEPAEPAALQGPSDFTKQTTLDEINCLVIDSVVAFFGQGTEKVNDHALDFLRLNKTKQNGTNICRLGAPLFWNCTAWLVTLPVAAATGLELLLTSGASA